MLVIFGVIVVEPWYEPKYAISLSGMVFANAMTGHPQCRPCVPGWEWEERSSCAQYFVECCADSSFLAVGLVSLPGIMTGQVIAGADPMEAVRYQIMVMSLVMGSAGFAVASMRRTHSTVATSQ